MADAVQLERAAAQWQWAFDAADRALAADRLLLSAEVLRAESHALGDERRVTARLLDRSAALYPPEHRPWLCPLPVTPHLLGLLDQTEACIFDLDGVLTNSHTLHAAAWAEALDPVLAAASADDRRFTRFDRAADYRAYFDGRTRLEGIRLFLEGRGLRLPPAAVEEIAQRKGRLLAHGLGARGVAAMPGAARYLQAAHLGRIGRAVVSASTTARRMLDHAALDGLLDVVVDAQTIRSEHLRTRPSPDVLLRACAELGTEPAHTVAITHSGAGVLAASGAGMPGILIGAPGAVPSLASLLDRRLLEPATRS